MKKAANFNGDMVRAVLSGKKTQMRIPVQWPVISKSDGTKQRIFAPVDVDLMNETLSEKRRSPLLKIGPFGQVGGQIYVRETFCLEHQVEHGQPPPFDDGRPIRYLRDGIPCNKEFSEMWLQPHYRATDPTPELSYEDSDGEPTVRWKSPVIMPKWASRITLDITGIRIQKIQDMTEEEAVAEGFLPHDVMTGLYWFAEAWDSLHGKAFSWESNPWVWCVTFRPPGRHESIRRRRKRHEKRVKRVEAT